MKVIWAVLCEKSLTDSETNNVSLINVIEEVTVPAQPPIKLSDLGLPEGIVPTVLELVVLWVRSNLDEPEHGQGRVQIAIPNSYDASTQQFEVDLTHFLRLRSRIKLTGIPAGGEGIYLFKIAGKTASSDWTEMFELPLRLAFQTQDPV